MVPPNSDLPVGVKLAYVAPVIKNLSPTTSAVVLSDQAVQLRTRPTFGQFNDRGFGLLSVSLRSSTTAPAPDRIPAVQHRPAIDASGEEKFCLNQQTNAVKLVVSRLGTAKSGLEEGINQIRSRHGPLLVDRDRLNGGGN
jgi:hypothetical protein